MDSIHFLRALKRRWFVVVIAVVVAILASVTAWHPGAKAMGRYQASTTLIKSDSAPKTMTMTGTALYLSEGAVPARAATTLHYHGNADALASKLTISANDKVGSIGITMTGNNAGQLGATVNAFSGALIDELRSLRTQQNAALKATTTIQLQGISAQLSQLDKSISKAPTDSALLAQRNALATRYQTVSKTLDQVAVDDANQLPSLIQLQSAAVSTLGASSFDVLNHTSARLLIAALIGLLLGLGLVYLLERFDTRLRDRASFEHEFALPVLAEVPTFPRSRRAPGLEILRAPASAAAEAYRGLRSAVLLSASIRAGSDSPSGLRSLVLLVTSPSSSEGRTSTVANLAACMAESGRSVLVLDCDFRDPQAHEYFNRPAGRGMSDLLASQLVAELDNLAGPTSVAGVRLVPSGTATDQPAALLSRMGPLVEAARQLADVVLIDSPPILESNDAMDLLPHVDAVLIVARSSQTTAAQAERTADLMRRVGGTALGIALIGPARRRSGGGARRSGGTLGISGSKHGELDRPMGGVVSPRESSSQAMHRSFRLGGRSHGRGTVQPDGGI